MQNHQLINQTSLNTEYFTPPLITSAVRQLLGTIDLDPASCPAANKFVKAEKIFVAPKFLIVGEIESNYGAIDPKTKQPILTKLPIRKFIDRGALEPQRRWIGNVFMNHPFGTAERACQISCTKKACLKRGYHTQTDLPGNEDWIGKIITEHKHLELKAGVCITFASTSENWFQPLLDYPQCWLCPRTNYVSADGKIMSGVSKGSVLTFFGVTKREAKSVFKKFGKVK